MKRNSSSKVIRIFTSTVLLAVGTSLCLIGSASLVAADCTPPASGLISWWPGEGNGSDIISTNNGTLSPSGASYATGLVGQAFRFDGTNGYVRIPDAPALKPTNVTVEAWVWLDPALPPNRGGEQIIFKKNTWSAWFEGYSLMKITLDNGNGTYSDRFQFVVSRTGNQVIINSTTIAQRGVWYHVAATYDGNQSTLYVNGAAEATATAGFALDYGNDPVYLGTSGTWSPYLSMFGGIIDEPAIYSRALSSNEIIAIYNAGSAGKCSPTESAPLVIAGPITNQANGHIYYLLASSAWTDAEARAVTLGGHLATINDAAEDTWVFGMFGSYGGINRNLWIGLRDTANDTATVAASHATNFLWVSGSNASYRNWYPGEPNNGDWTGIKEYFGFIDYFYGGKWQDSVDSAQLPGKSEGQYGVVEIPTTGNNPICTPPPSGLVGWWPGEGSASDIIGTNNGTLQGNLAYINGLVGTAFIFKATNANVKIPASSALNVGLGSGFTLESWINMSNATARTPIFEWNNGAGNWGVHFWVSPGYQGELYANVVDSGGGWHQLSSAAGLVQSGIYKHVALTYDKSSGVAKIYLNGNVVAQQFIGSFTPLTSYDLYLGWRASGAPGDVGTLIGIMDEPSVYNRALDTNEIAAIYAAGSAGKCLAPSASPIPVITDFSPKSATNGAILAIIGTNFSLNVASNIVYLGAVEASVLATTPTSLTVIVPPGATFAPPSVTVGGLTGIAKVAFTPTFSGGGLLNVSSFAARVNLTPGTNPTKTVIADFDGDGKPDLATADGTTHTISIFRNISATGNLNAGSFGSRIVLSTPGTGANTPYMMAAADMDGDGKIDLITGDLSANTVSVYRNLASPGNLVPNSFAARVSFAVGSSPRELAVVDLDGDGRPEIISANYGSSNISVLKNLSSAGIITNNSFAAHVDYPTGSGPSGMAVADFDGDGKPDVATANNSAGTLSLLRNMSTAGVLNAASFSAAATLPALAYAHFLRAADLDGDSKPDLILTSYLGQNIAIYRNIATPGTLASTSFQSGVALGLGARGNTISIGDLNGDSKPDVVVECELPNRVCVFQNLTTSGSFTSSSLAARLDLPAGSDPWGSTVGDLDGDGRPDIVFVNYYDNTLSIVQNLSSTPPVVLIVTPTNWFVNEGSTVSFAAVATGSPTPAYQWKFEGASIADATNATLTLSNVDYSQAGIYTVVASNPFGLASSNVTLRVNRAPIADASASESLVISPNDTNAIAVLDGSRSSDPDGDALNYAWFITGEAAPFTTGVVTMKSLPVGTNYLILTVNDGMASGSQNFAVEVITASQAVDRLSQLVKTNSSNSMALIASLRAALLAIDRSHPAVAIQMLEVFINKVHVQLEPVDPALAAEFIAEAQAIIDALNGDGNVALKAIEILPITPGANGKSHLKIKGNANRTYVIETSTNMVDWVPAGVATRAEDGTYEFDDTQAQGVGVRFYRVVSPQ